MGLYAEHVSALANGGLWQFARWMRVPGPAGEALIMCARSGFPVVRHFAVYALCPAAILVSRFHDSTDCPYVALVLAAIAFDRRRYFLSSTLWSAARTVKPMPLVLIPLVFVGIPNLKPLPAAILGMLAWMVLVHSTWTRFQSSWGISV
jgi:hypothetical protein